MNITGLHLLLTYQCNHECEHCFVWGSPQQSDTMTLGFIRRVLEQAGDAGIEWIYFEGGEPFLYYRVLLEGVRQAAESGFRVGIVSNAYWATDADDAVTWLQPFAGRVQDLSISADDFHGGRRNRQRTENAVRAAKALGVPVGVISIAPPELTHRAAATGQAPPDTSAVVFRGRAAEKLAPRADHHFWTQFTECPSEDLRSPGRVHLDARGYVHVCQGISIGNVNDAPLKDIFAGYDPDAHPVTGPLLAGGPAELARHHAMGGMGAYADACHLCYETRLEIRDELPDVLAPGAMYGAYSFTS